MAVKSIGQVLKEKRTELGLGLAEAERITKVQKLYIVALETDDYKALPSDFYVRAYLKQYAEKLGLNAEKILEAHDAGRDITVEEEEDIQDTYQFIKPSERYEEEPEEEISKFRYYLPIISLSAAALLIVAVVAVAVVLNRPSASLEADNYSVSTSQTSESMTSSSALASSSKAPEQNQLAVTGSGNALTVNLTQATTPVKLVFTVAGTNTVNASLTNADWATAQQLSSSNPTATANLAAGTTSSVISLDSTQGLTLTVNGKPLSLSGLTQAGTITLNIAAASTTASH